MDTGQEFVHSGMAALPRGAQVDRVPLYRGIELIYYTLVEDPASIGYEAPGRILQINYCRTGQAVWTAGNGDRVDLGPGNFSLHNIGACTDPQTVFPKGSCQGLTVFIDFSEVSASPPELLADPDIFETPLLEKFGQDDPPVLLTGDERTESIFSGFYDQPKHLRLPYQRVKVLELLLYLTEMDLAPQEQPTGHPTEQIEIIREIHDQLLHHMDRRITIEELSREYLINPTTLKAAFKSVYGTSLAAHIREHRMEQAAKLLKESSMSIAEIAQAVGYDSQSKFSAAFKAVFKVLPREYRKQL